MVQKEQFVSKKKQSILVLGEQLWVGGYLRLLVVIGVLTEEGATI